MLGLEESLIRCARKGDLKQLEGLLVQNQVSPDVVYREERRVSFDHGTEVFRYERTALVEASLHGHINVVRRLIAAGVDVNKISVGKDHEGKSLQCYSPLSAALMKGQEDIATLLLENVADVKFVAEISRLTFELTNRDGEYDFGSDVLKYSTLHLAIRAGMSDRVIRELFEKGANKNFQAKFQNSYPWWWYALAIGGFTCIWLPCAVAACTSKDAREWMMSSKVYTATELAKKLNNVNAMQILNSHTLRSSATLMSHRPARDLQAEEGQSSLEHDQRDIILSATM